MLAVDIGNRWRIAMRFHLGEPKMPIRSHRYILLLSVLAGALSMQSACSRDADADTVNGRVVIVDRTVQGLTLAELESVDGTYTGCRGRTDADPWSIAIAGGATLANDPLTVVVNDLACQLTLTDLVTTGEGTLAASTPIELSDMYGMDAASFGSPILFYANARITPADFSVAFVLDILFSDTPVADPRTVIAALAVVTSTATAEAVPAPDTALDLSGFTFETDFNDVVTTFEGDAVLTAGSVPGQEYVLVQGTVGSGYDEVEAAFIAGTPAAVPGTIAAADFMVSGDVTVSVVRTLIISNTVSGVTSYQVFAITFSALP
jgi:hypothetical protein